MDHFEEEGECFLQQIVTGDKIGPITMIQRTKDSLWNNSTKDHQYKTNSKPKPLLVKLC